MNKELRIRIIKERKIPTNENNCYATQVEFAVLVGDHSHSYRTIFATLDWFREPITYIRSTFVVADCVDVDYSRVLINFMSELGLSEHEVKFVLDGFFESCSNDLSD